MSLSIRSARSTALTALLLCVVGAVGFVSVRWVTDVVKSDALAPYRAQNTPFKLGEGVIMEGFSINSYLGSRLVTEAKVKEAVIRGDRSLVDLKGVYDGKFYDEDGKVYQFSANAATYGTYSKAIIAREGIRVWNEKVDLQAAGFVYDHNTRTLVVEGAVTGKINGGDTRAESLELNLAKGSLSTGKIAWTGPLQVEGRGLTRWSISSDSSSHKDGITTFINAKGSDKDTIVKSDKMTHDRTNEIVTAQGNVEYFGQEANVDCEKVVIERKLGKATLTGKKVTMLIKPEETAPKESQIPPVSPLVPVDVANSRPTTGDTPEEEARRRENEQIRSPENLRQYPLAITASKIEYWYRKGQRRAVVTGSPFARQELGAMKWRELYAFRAEYDGEKEQLRLSSQGSQRNIRVINSIGDDLLAETFIVSTKKDDDSYEGTRIEGVYMVDDNDLPQQGGSTGGGTSTGGVTGGGTTGGSPPRVSGRIGT